MKKDNTLTELIVGIILLGIVEQIICIIISKDYLYDAAGLWSGIMVAAGMAVHMKRSIEDALDFGEEGAAKHIQKSYAVRMIVAFLVMGAVIYFDLGNPLTLLAGVFPLKISAYLQPHMHKVFLKLEKDR